MPIDIKRGLDFGGAVRITSLPDAIALQEPATLAQLNSAVEGLAWKDSCRVSTQANLTLTGPGATIDGITMVAGDRILVQFQTAGAENGIYIWNGAAVAATRSLDANTANELEQAVVVVEEGTSANLSYRQSVVNATLGTTALVWNSFGGSAPAATTTVAGIIRIGTQAEVDAITLNTVAITPATLGASPNATKKFNANVGDGTATSYVITHNLNTRDVAVEVYRNSGNFDTVLVEVQRTSVNSLTLVFDVAPTAAQFRVQVRT